MAADSRLSPVVHGTLDEPGVEVRCEGWVGVRASERKNSISGSQKGSMEPHYCISEWSPHHSSSFYSGVAAIITSSPQPSQEDFVECVLQERRRGPEQLRDQLQGHTAGLIRLELESRYVGLWVRTLRTGQDWEELREAGTMVLLKGLGEDQIHSTQEGKAAKDQ